MKRLFCFLTLTYLSLAAREKEEDAVPIGNLALKTSQQPGPLFCFGQNIVDKGTLQLYGYFDYLSGKNVHFTELIPEILYGITDNFSIDFGVPFALKFKQGSARSQGIEDCILQAEYAFYNDDHPTYGNQLTAVGNITFPSGSASKNPPTGLGSPSFFLGLTASHLSEKWYLFLSPGYIITTPMHNQSAGNQWLYQWGIGRNLYYQSNKLIFTGIIEFFGTHGGVDTLPLKGSRRLGGDNLFIGPSLWLATPHYIFNVGIAFPAMQKITRYNPKKYFLFAAEMAYTF